MLACGSKHMTHHWKLTGNIWPEVVVTKSIFFVLTWMCHWIGSSLIYIMACFLFVANPYLNQWWLLIHQTPKNRLEWKNIETNLFSLRKLHFKLSFCNFAGILSMERLVKWLVGVCPECKYWSWSPCFEFTKVVSFKMKIYIKYYILSFIPYYTMRSVNNTTTINLNIEV